MELWSDIININPIQFNVYVNLLPSDKKLVQKKQGTTFTLNPELTYNDIINNNLKSLKILKHPRCFDELGNTKTAAFNT